MVVSSYLNVETTKDQCRLLNPKPLECIVGYKVEDAVNVRCCNIVLQFTNRVMRYVRYGTHSCEVRKVRHTQL